MGQKSARKFYNRKVLSPSRISLIKSLWWLTTRGCCVSTLRSETPAKISNFYWVERVKFVNLSIIIELFFFFSSPNCSPDLISFSKLPIGLLSGGGGAAWGGFGKPFVSFPFGIVGGGGAIWKILEKLHIHIRQVKSSWKKFERFQFAYRRRWWRCIWWWIGCHFRRWHVILQIENVRISRTNKIACQTHLIGYRRWRR